ncbi:MAG: DNA translocase FtsK, partial [bacterium]|nr:DNA translocase FtsK [bacterium]
MAKKKQSSSLFPLRLFSIPEHIQRPVWGVAFFVLSLIFLLSFFEQAGRAGAFFLALFEALLGRGVVLLPPLLALAGVVFFGMKGASKNAVFLALLLSLVGIVGLLSSIADKFGVDTKFGGWLGFLISWPFLELVEVWVSMILFASLLVISFIIFWKVLPHEDEGSGITKFAGDRIKKIFEPSFEVHEVEEDQEEEKQIEEKESKEKGKVKEKLKPFASPVFLGDYKLPPADILESDKGIPNAGDIKVYSAVIKKTLQNFGIPVEVTEVNIGPAVTQYAIKPAEGIKLSRITTLYSDLSLALAAHPIRIEAPIPGRSLVGIEIPNRVRAVVKLRELVEHQQFLNHPSPLALGLGRDVSGNPAFGNLASLPHLLVAGATGSGKTIGLHNIILSLLYRNSPETLRLILVDPKRVEFPVFNDLPHLLMPVILDAQHTLNALKWLIKEMERRFDILSQHRLRDIASYQEYVREQREKGVGDDLESMPYIVVVIDELADLMAARGKEMEGLIVRLAQMSRAVGIHLVLATQRPSVEIITGTIKANITGRIAFQVASQIDSRTILDMAGAEKLLGKGDMLYLSAEFSRPKRLQGAFISDKEVKKVVTWLERENKEIIMDRLQDDDLGQSAGEDMEVGGSSEKSDDDDTLYEEAKRVVIESKKASASLLQRRLKVGYARAARLIDILEERGVVGPADGARPREVYVHGSEDEDGS